MLPISATTAFVWAGLLALAIAVVSSLKASGRAPALDRIGPRHYRRASVMTANEWEFHQRILAALPQGAEAWPQVPFLSLLQPLSGETYGAAKAKITNKRLDWVIALDGEGRIAIELDDASHDTKRDADRERDEILRGCGYTVVRFESRSKPTIAALSEAFERGLSPKAVAPLGFRKRR